MVERSNSERLRGFCYGLTDVQTDICDSRVAFATEKGHKRNKIEDLFHDPFTLVIESDWFMPF